jgi:carboxymethylenebutenolidase
VLHKSEHLKKYYMKKLLYSLFAVFLTASLLGWNWQQNQHPVVDKGDVIECLNMETQQAYQIEASQTAFAAMHQAPLVISPATLLGKMTNFTAADGKNASAYFIASKKKSNKWLIVIQEWWGLNDQIKLEADKYFTDLGDVNVMAVDMYDGKVAATPDSAMKLMLLYKVPLNMPEAMPVSIQWVGALVVCGVCKLLF